MDADDFGSWDGRTFWKRDDPAGVDRLPAAANRLEQRIKEAEAEALLACAIARMLAEALAGSRQPASVVADIHDRFGAQLTSPRLPNVRETVNAIQGLLS